MVKIGTFKHNMVFVSNHFAGLTKPLFSRCTNSTTCFNIRSECDPHLKWMICSPKEEPCVGQNVRWWFNDVNRVLLQNAYISTVWIYHVADQIWASWTTKRTGSLIDHRSFEMFSRHNNINMPCAYFSSVIDITAINFQTAPIYQRSPFP